MNIELTQIPFRSAKPRSIGYTMVMDKGLSLREIEDMVSVSGDYIDVVKLGFGTSALTPILDEKIKLYQDLNIPVYFGGTLFEAFVIRDQFSDYVKLLNKYRLEYVEVSDGCIEIDHKEKCKYIRDLAQDFKVLSEVGSKDVEKIIPPYKWIELMAAELEANAHIIIAEARESGTVGIYRQSGEIRMGLVEEILTQIPKEKVLWEAPIKSQQVWFIQNQGSNVSLGNIASNDIIPLETLRLGLRGDTFHTFLDKLES